MEIDTSYGYPLLKHIDESGNIIWYYPNTPGKEGVPEPKLIRVIPQIVYHGKWRICVAITQQPGMQFIKILDIRE